MYRTPSIHRHPQAAVETGRGVDSGGTEARSGYRNLVRRERDFGVGYGRSSGYASPRSYSVPQAAYFRCR